jgi:hypothetical protein
MFTLLATVPVFVVEALISVSLKFSVPISIACIVMPSIERSLITDSLENAAPYRTLTPKERVTAC